MVLLGPYNLLIFIQIQIPLTVATTFVLNGSMAVNWSDRLTLELQIWHRSHQKRSDKAISCIYIISLTSWVHLCASLYISELLSQFWDMDLKFGTRSHLHEKLLIVRNCRYWTTIKDSCLTNRSIKSKSLYGNIRDYWHTVFSKQRYNLRRICSGRTTILYSYHLNWQIKIRSLYTLSCYKKCTCEGYLSFARSYICFYFILKPVSS